jgi:hypothetical protein
MEKKIVKKEIFYLSSRDEITWKNIKHIEFQDDDIIDAFEDNGDYSFCVLRPTLETDAEYEARMVWSESTREMLKKTRYTQYLKLKEEFENE